MLTTDAELRGLLDALRAYCFRGLTPYDARRPWAAGRLLRLTPRVPVLLPVAEFTPAALRERFGDAPIAPSFPRANDPKGEALSWHLSRRVAVLLTSALEHLRTRRWNATGIPAGGSEVQAILSDIWHRDGIAFDRNSSAILAAGNSHPLFVVVSIEPQRPPLAAPARTAARSVLDRFVSTFNDKMLTPPRVFTLEEFVAAARQHLCAGISAREVAAALRRASPSAWAKNGDGRPPTRLKPTAAELAAAGRAAAAAAEACR